MRISGIAVVSSIAIPETVSLSSLQFQVSHNTNPYHFTVCKFTRITHTSYNTSLRLPVPCNSKQETEWTLLTWNPLLFSLHIAYFAQHNDNTRHGFLHTITFIQRKCIVKYSTRCLFTCVCFLLQMIDGTNFPLITVLNMHGSYAVPVINRVTVFIG